MTLPASGAISFNNINVELGVSGTTQASLGQSSYRTLAGVPSGAISMSNFWGKANQFAFTISSNQTNANLRTLAINAGWNQSSALVATINSGVYCSANSTGTPGLTINGSFPGGVTLVNNGYIIGMGGNGGAGTNYAAGGANGGAAGSAGGLALSVSSSVTIQNNGTIGGGGGGGGGGKAGFWPIGCCSGYTSGGGGGGGRSGATNSSGGAASYCYNPPGANQYSQAGGAGTSAGAGTGGQGRTAGAAGSALWASTKGGDGGNWGSSGASGSAPGFTLYAARGPFGGGGGGAAVSGNGYISWSATGTRLGGIS